MVSSSRLNIRRGKNRPFQMNASQDRSASLLWAVSKQTNAASAHDRDKKLTNTDDTHEEDTHDAEHDLGRRKKLMREKNT